MFNAMDLKNMTIADSNAEKKGQKPILTNLRKKLIFTKSDFLIPLSLRSNVISTYDLDQII